MNPGADASASPFFVHGQCEILSYVIGSEVLKPRPLLTIAI
jgi:hypothetical protein